ncbi:putative transcription factor WD40-like family [Dioscorea sansibarensis]
MARRAHHHLREVGFIAGEDLAGIGAGEKEGWLSDSSLLAALHPRALALARSDLALILALDSPSAYSVRIRPSLSPEDGQISALEWLSPSSDDALALAIGTSGGSLLIYSLDADLIHKQFIHPGRVLRLRFREIKGNSQQDAVSDELCVVMPGVIARFDGSDIQSLLRRWFEEDGSRDWESKLNKRADHEDSHGRIPFQLWNVGKYGSCVDAAITGLMAPPLLEFQSGQRYYCGITIGDDAVISAYRLSVDRSRSFVGAILSKVVPVTFSTLASVSRMIWRSEQTSTKKPRPSPPPFAKASSLTCLKDPPRKGERLTLSPTGTLAAITDSLGRVLLLDTQALVVVRLWKGYRDAHCLFVEMLINKDKPSSSSTPYVITMSDYCLCLAIHAPRKEIIEVWQMRTGPRLLTIQCPKGSRILQPSTRFPSSDSSSYHPLEVFVLNGDSGQLLALNNSIG